MAEEKECIYICGFSRGVARLYSNITVYIYVATSECQLLPINNGVRCDVRPRQRVIYRMCGGQINCDFSRVTHSCLYMCIYNIILCI